MSGVRYLEVEKTANGDAANEVFLYVKMFDKKAAFNLAMSILKQYESNEKNRPIEVEIQGSVIRESEK